MKKQQMTSFYIEALLLALIFVGMILVLTKVFGASRAQSTEARQLTTAVTLAANAAEAVSAADDPEALLALLDEGGNARWADGELELGYEADGSPCASSSPALRLRVSWERAAEDPNLVYSEIRVYAADVTEPVFRLETAAGKEAAA